MYAVVIGGDLSPQAVDTAHKSLVGIIGNRQRGMEGGFTDGDPIKASPIRGYARFTRQRHALGMADNPGDLICSGQSV